MTTTSTSKINKVINTNNDVQTVKMSAYGCKSPEVTGSVD